VSAELIAAYAGGSVTQAALVAGGAVRCVPSSLRALRHPLFAALPLLGLVGVVLLLRAAPQQAGALAEIALLGVPLLALIAAARTGVVAFALVVAMVVVTVHDSSSVAGQIAALGLIAASCTVLGALLVEVTPAHWPGARRRAARDARPHAPLGRAADAVLRARRRLDLPCRRPPAGDGARGTRPACG
jgi:hypothetical protein